MLICIPFGWFGLLRTDDDGRLQDAVSSGEGIGNAKCKARIDALGKNPCKPDGSFYGYEEHAYYIKHAGFKKGDGHGTVTKKSLH